MRSWVFRNLARLAVLRGRPAAPPAPLAARPGVAEGQTGRPKVRELQPVRRRSGNER